jgi:hypothetical protein
VVEGRGGNVEYGFREGSPDGICILARGRCAEHWNVLLPIFHVQACLGGWRGVLRASRLFTDDSGEAFVVYALFPLLLKWQGAELRSCLTVLI